jgi:VanZ family protein
LKFARFDFYLKYVLPFAAWLGLIHFSSSQSYEDQNVQPLLEGFPLDWVHTIFSWVSFRYGDSIVSLETRSPEAFVEFFIRKGAHVFVYAVLAVLAFRLMYKVFPKLYPSTAAAWLFVTIYAGIDELRQHFHPNRSGMIEDVILDSAGGIIGLVIYIGWLKKRS